MNERMPLSKALAVAERVRDGLAPLCTRIEIAGSVRRRRPDCGDIDIVLETADRAAVEARIQQRCRIEKNGPQYLVALMEDGTQLDLWFAHGPTMPADMFATEPEPGNFGSLLLCRTGSAAHNIHMVEMAKKAGLRWHPHRGVMKGDRVIAAETEQEIFRAVGMLYVPPERRER